MSVNTEPNCIYEGSKFFWRTRNNIDINIIEHSTMGVYEVVLYEPAIDAEAKRVYLDGKILKSKLNNDDIEEQESFAMRNNIPITEEFLAGLQNKSITEYLQSRTKIDKYVQEEKIIEASMHFTEADLAAGVADSSLIIKKPEALQPFAVKHHKLLMANVVQEVMVAMQQDKKAMQDFCETASEISDLVDPNPTDLTVRQRWRMPLVIGKVARSQQLTWGDKKIYKKFHANMKASAASNTPASLASSRRGSAGSVMSVATPRSAVSRTRRGSKEEQCALSRGTGSTLFADTANTRQRRSSTEAEAAPKHRKGKLKRGNSVRRKKGAQTPRTKRSQASRGSTESATSTSDKSPDKEGAADADDSDESDNEGDEFISSHVQRLVAGLKTLGSAIKSSFSFSLPANRSLTIEPILEQDEHNHSVNNSVSQQTAKNKGEKTPTSSDMKAPQQSVHATITTTTASDGAVLTTTASDGAVLVQQPAEGPPSRLRGTSADCMEHSALSGSESKLRAKPVRRKSYLDSFIQALTGSNKISTTAGTTTITTSREWAA